MSRIRWIAIHGTNDDHPDDAGVQWWQNDSPFQSRLKAQLGVDAETVDFEPFHWGGANSDVARRGGAAKLAARLRKALSAGERVVVAAHSHGGNVVAYAIGADAALQAALKAGDLRVVTIGAPFIAGRRRWVSRINEVARRLVALTVIVALAVITLPFSRVVQDRLVDGGVLDEGGRELLNNILALAYELRMVLADFGLESQSLAEANADLDRQDLVALGALANAAGEGLGFLLARADMVLIVLAALAIAVLVRPILAAIGRLRAALLARRWRSEASSPTWRTIMHPKDEAATLLATAPTLALEPLAPGSAPRSIRRTTPVLSLIALVAIVAFANLQGPQTLDAFRQSIANRAKAIALEDAWYSTVTLEGYPIARDSLRQRWDEEARAFVVSDARLYEFVDYDEAASVTLRERIDLASSKAMLNTRRIDALNAEWERVIQVIAAPLIIFFTVLAFIAVYAAQLVIVALSPLIGGVIRAGANGSVTGLLRGAALGQDGDHILKPAAAEPPKGFAHEAWPMPDDFAQRMQDDADRNAGESLRRLRSTVGAIESKAGQATGDAMSDLLSAVSWRELIHTSYFEYDEISAAVADVVKAQISAARAGAPKPDAAAATA